MIRLTNLFRKERFPMYITIGITILISLLLKAYYSQAEPAGLQWILAPIAWCVSLVSGSTFQFNPELGYVSEQLHAVIAPVCAGVNFMIIVFGMSAVAGIIKGKGRLVFNVVAALLIAYFSTVIINSLRISMALVLYHYEFSAGWFTVERVHRLLGIVVYITALYAISGLLYRNILRRRQRPFNDTYHRVLPLLSYIAITVAVPAVLGKYAYYGKQFTEHILFILLSAAGVFLLPFILKSAGRLSIRRKMESQ